MSDVRSNPAPSKARSGRKRQPVRQDAMAPEHRRRRRKPLRLVRGALIDLAVLVGALVIAVRASGPIDRTEIADLGLIITTLITWVVALGANTASWGPLMRGRPPISHHWRTSMIVLVCGAGAAYFLPYYTPKVTYTWFAFLGLAGIMAVRWLERQRVRRERRRFQSSAVPVLIFGRIQEMDGLIRRLNGRTEMELMVVGLVLDSHLDSHPGGTVAGVPILGDSLEMVPEMAYKVGAQAVVVADGSLRPDMLMSLSWNLERVGVPIALATSVESLELRRLQPVNVASLLFLGVRPARFSGPRFVVKRVIDVVGAVVLFIVLSPLLVSTALAVKIESRGPVLFSQERVGRGGRIFKLAKFRSMKVGADAHIAALQEEDIASGDLFRIRLDPRVTRVGRFIRKYSIDELPGLWNVVRGDMSLVGPPPLLQTEVSTYEKQIQRRFLVRPGLTGIWQISGRSDISWDESVRLDVYYVENWSIAGDLIILVQTLRAVLSARGAY